jgi:26S proteasome regulatory subunit N8
VIIDVNSDDPIQLPTEAYMAVDEVTKSGEIFQNFIHLPSTVQAIEPEEIGVEQLLREMNTISGHSLTSVMQ